MISKELIKQMPVEEKVAHLIIVRCALFGGRIEEMLENGKIAGIGAVALKSDKLDEVITQINDWKRRAKLPLMLFADGERGLAQQIDGATQMPRVMAIGAAGDEGEELAELHGRVVAREAKALGFNILACPSVDVNIAPDNPIILTRAFSDDTDTVIKLGRAYIKGMQSQGVVCTAKHYPGHGATNVDSHMAMPCVERSREELMDVELRPYKEICNDVHGVMTAHICYPALAAQDEKDVPATMSRTIIYDILRGEFGYDNLIISDSLTMKGIKDRYGDAAATGAIKAGHDLVLQDYVADPMTTYESVLKAVCGGQISMQQLDESVLRIMKFKEMIGCIGNKPVDREEARRIVGCDEHREIAERIARASITAVECTNMPFNPKKTGKTLVIATVGPEEVNEIIDMGRAMGAVSKKIAEQVQKFCKADVERISEEPTAECVNEVIERAKGYDTVIFAAFIRNVSYKENSGKLHCELVRMVETLEASGAAVATLIFGNPYVVSEINNIKDCLVAYYDDIHSIKAAVQALFGEFAPTGKLPVNVSKKYPRGYSAV